MTDTIGQTLRTNRELRNLSLEQVSKATHIRIRFLEALENDQRDLLPSLVQGKGFLRLYADFLEIPDGPLLEFWDHITTENNAEISQQPKMNSRTASKGSSLKNGTVTNKDQSIDENPLAENINQSESEVDKESRNIFREIGETLQNQRISLGITLQEIEKHTRVRLHSLELLEQGRMEELASMVQARGMLSNYAHFLNLDVDTVLLRFADALQIRLIENNALPFNKTLPKKSAPKRTSGWKQLFTTDLIVGSFVILGLVVFGIWSAAQVSSSRGNNNIATIVSISDILLQTQNSGTQPSPGTLIPPTPTSSNQQVTKTVVNPNNPPLEITGTLPVIGNSPLQVFIVTHQRTWMRITVDKKVVFDGRTLPGNAYPYGGDNAIEVLSGNAAAIEVIFNQNSLGSLGLPGQVVSLIFTKNGIITPTPMFTVTPTSTLAPTATSLPSPTQTITPSVTPLIP